MTCNHCGAVLEHEARFCASCGTPADQQGKTTEADQNIAPAVQQDEVAAATADQGGPVPQGAPESAEEPKKWTEHKLVTGTVDVSKNYWEDFKKSLITPAAYSQETTRDGAINGTITIALLSLFIAGVFYSTNGMLFNKITVSFAELFGIESKPSFLKDFIRPLVVYLLLFAIATGSIFLVCRLMQSKQSFLDIVARFGAFLTIPTILFLLVLFFGIIGSYKLVLYLFVIGLLSIGTAISYTIYTFRNQESGGLDPLYGVITAYVISGIGYLILNELFY